ATVSHTFRVASAECPSCGCRNQLYPHAMVSLLQRKERGIPDAWLVCSRGHLVKGRRDQARRCPDCKERIDPNSSYTTRRIATCMDCGARSRLQELAETGSWRWDVVMVERTFGRVRELDRASPAEVATAGDSNRKPTKD